LLELVGTLRFAHPTIVGHRPNHAKLFNVAIFSCLNLVGDLVTTGISPTGSDCTQTTGSPCPTRRILSQRHDI
jgi:hypothetical protein